MTDRQRKDIVEYVRCSTACECAIFERKSRVIVDLFDNRNAEGYAGQVRMKYHARVVGRYVGIRPM